MTALNPASNYLLSFAFLIPWFYAPNVDSLVWWTGYFLINILLVKILLKQISIYLLQKELYDQVRTKAIS